MELKANKKYEKQKEFWEYAGKIGYGQAQFTHQSIEDHILATHWQTAINIAKSLGLSKESTILELGCGDGKFSEKILAGQFKHTDAFDISEAAIERAKSLSKSKKVSYFAKDVTNYEYEKNAHWDGAFLMVFLHHVKAFTPTIIARLAKVCPKVIVVEPNGNNIIRKLLELLPSYKQAGEESFKLKELITIFDTYNYKIKTIQRVTFIPQFLPKFLFPLFKKLETLIESSSILSRLCSTYVLGFERISS